MDQFREYIENNREEFEVSFKSRDAVWMRIEKQLPARQRQLTFSVYRVAASVALILAVGIAIGLYVNKSHIEEMAVRNSMPQEYQDAIRYYEGQINSQLVSLNAHQGNEQVQKDIQELDEFLQELKKDLQNAPVEYRSRILSKIIENYKLRLSILEEVQNSYQEKQTEINKEHIQL